jgi:hypothetical protein
LGEGWATPHIPLALVAVRDSEQTSCLSAERWTRSLRSPSGRCTANAGDVSVFINPLTVCAYPFLSVTYASTLACASVEWTAPRGRLSVPLNPSSCYRCVGLDRMRTHLVVKLLCVPMSTRTHASCTSHDIAFHFVHRLLVLGCVTPLILGLAPRHPHPHPHPHPPLLCYVLRGVRGTASMGGEPKPDRYSELVKQALDSGPVSRAPSSIHHASMHGTCALPLYCALPQSSQSSRPLYCALPQSSQSSKPLYCALPQSSQSSRPLTDSNVASYFLLFSRGACCTPCATLTKTRILEYGSHACGVVWCGLVRCGVVMCDSCRHS